MTTTQHGSWEHFGRAAEHLARRVARDARRFAARVEEHVGEFAHDVRRGWHCTDTGTPHAPEDVQHVFEDIRTVLAGVLDGVDEFITHVFPADAAPGWTRVVLNRDATCTACARPIAAGSEGHVRAASAGKEFRCLDCGTPA